MTTIAYDHKNKIIAIDGRTTSDGVIVSDESVKWKIDNDGSYWFFAGTVADQSKIMSLNHDDKPEVQPDCAAILVKKGGVYIVSFNGDYCCHTPALNDRAIGSGWKFALSALKFGNSAKEAVNHASEMDIYTGGKITVFDVENMEFVG